MQLHTANIRTGDLLFFEGNRFFSRLIQCWQWLRGKTHWRYSHVGFVVLRWTEGKRDLWVCEALSGPGIATRQLREYLAEDTRNGVRIVWYRLVPVVDRARLAGLIDAELSKPYGTWWQFAWSFSRLGEFLRKKFGLSPLVDHRGEFCSEYGASVFRTYGLIGDLEPALTSPADLAEAWFLEEQGLLENDTES